MKNKAHLITNKKILKALRFNHCCAYCGVKLNRNLNHKKSATLDHIIPKVHGGTNSNKNLTLACRSCNLKKASDPLFKNPRFTLDSIFQSDSAKNLLRLINQRRDHE